MYLFLDAVGRRLGLCKEGGSVSWSDLEAEDDRFPDLLKHALPQRESLKMVEAIVVAQEGARFSDVRAAVVVANGLHFTHGIPVYDLRSQPIPEACTRSWLESLSSHPDGIKASYFAPPSISTSSTSA